MKTVWFSYQRGFWGLFWENKINPGSSASGSASVCFHFYAPAVPLSASLSTIQWFIWAPESRCLMLSEDQPSKIIHSRAGTSSRRGHFRGGCLDTIKSANAECKVTSGSPWLGGKLACWRRGPAKPTLESLSFPCLSGAAVHATRQPRPHKPPKHSPHSHSNVSINCRAVTNGVRLTGNTLALTVKPRLLMDVIRKVQSLSRLFHTTVPPPSAPSTWHVLYIQQALLKVPH